MRLQTWNSATDGQQHRCWCWTEANGTKEGNGWRPAHEPYPHNPVFHSEKVDEEYWDGYTRGLNWKENWTPGGPWHYYANEYDSEKSKQLAHETQAEHRAWMNGWYDGHKAQKDGGEA